MDICIYIYIHIVVTDDEKTNKYGRCNRKNDKEFM